LKKSSRTSNIVLVWLAGLLILFGLFRYIRKKRNPNSTDLNPRFINLNTPFFDEIYTLIRKEEGFNPVAVRDGTDRAGNALFTIGIGHQIQPNESNLLTKRISELEARAIYEIDIRRIVEDMENNINVLINKNQFLALISLRYNIGGPQFNSSSLLRKLNASDYTGAADEFAKWRLSDGRINNVLVARRAREKSLFLKPV